jgi:hypothetical protein
MDAEEEVVVPVLRAVQVVQVERYVVPVHSLQRKPGRLLQSETFS